MLDLPKEVVKEMTQSVFNLYNRTTQSMQLISVGIGIELGQLEPELEAIFEPFPDIVAIEPNDVEIINSIKEDVLKEHGLMNVSGTADDQLDHLKQSLELIDFKLKALEKLGLWIEDNKPSKSSDEELEPYLERAKKFLNDLEDENLEFTSAFKRYRDIVMVSTEALEVLLIKHTKKES